MVEVFHSPRKEAALSSGGKAVNASLQMDQHNVTICVVLATLHGNRGVENLTSFSIFLILDRHIYIYTLPHQILK